MDTIEIAGRLWDDRPMTIKRLGDISDYHLYNMMQRGMPAPIRLGQRQWFDRRAVDKWVITQVYTKTPTHIADITAEVTTAK